MGRLSRERIFEQFGHAVGDLERIGGLPGPIEARDIWSDIWHREVHHSTAIEGNTLVLREVRELLDEGKAVGSKPLKEYLEVKGYGGAAQWVYEQAMRSPANPNLPPSVVNIREIREIHHVSMTPVWAVAPHPDAGPNESPGSYRRHDIHPFSGGMVPTHWPLVEAEMTDWVDQLHQDLAANVLATPTSALLWLARIHAKFEQIHPFIDGNGRTGRLVLNLVLVRLGLPPAIILKKQRDKYLRALDVADSGTCEPLAELLARSMISNLEQFIIPSLAGDARLVPLTSLVDEDFTREALHAAAARGRLEAHLGVDGKWRSSRRAVERYKTSRHKRKTE